MHVAIATWIALSAMSLNRRLGTLAVVYWAVICFGSVYLGWHYVMDGLGGIIISLVAWGAAGQLVPSQPGQFSSPTSRWQTIFAKST
jgi:membrane-associated phospholipid phosphatase